MNLSASGIAERERMFWDEHVPEFDMCLREYESGPDPNTRRMLEALEPLAGRRVLDLGCGVGVTSAWLARRGAVVTAIDISQASIDRAQELAERAGLGINFVIDELTPTTFQPGNFDAVAGRYVLHHLDLATVAPIIHDLLADGERGAFVETVAFSLLLRVCRRVLAGRAGIARYGTDDERPISQPDLDLLMRVFGSVTLDVGQMQFLRILDRNVLRYKIAPISAVLGAMDDALSRLGLSAWSYHQVVILRKPGGRAND